MVAPDKAIMEIKVNDAIPTRLTELISDFGLRLIRISKYCQGLETAEPVRGNVTIVTKGLWISKEQWDFKSHYKKSSGSPSHLLSKRRTKRSTLSYFW